ncbi:TPA: hypothetical protein ACPSKE_002441 [Legionella feeleii]
MISTTDILLNHLALELLRLRGVLIASGTFGDAIARIKLNPLELPEAQQPLHTNNEMPGNDMGFFIPIEPQENQDDSLFLLVQALLWLAANKNSNEKQKLEQQLAELIRNHPNILASYKGYSLVTLIIRSGSETVAKAAQDSIFKLPNYAMLDLLEFPAPDQESLLISAVKSGAEFIINLVQAMCLHAGFDSILTSEFLSTLEHLVERENDPDAKLALQQGHALCNEIMRINSERQQLEDERKADEYMKYAIRNEDLSPLGGYINSPANSNKIKPLLHFAIDGNKHSAILLIARRMTELGMMSEHELLNLCAKHIPHSKLYALIKTNPNLLLPTFSLEALTNESLKFIITYFPQDYKALVNTVAERELKNLLDHGLLLDLFICSDQARTNIMRRLAAFTGKEIVSLVTNDNSVVFLSCVLASGVEAVVLQGIATKNNYDWLSILLIAASYPGSQFSVETIKSFLNSADQQSLIVTNIHVFLARKLNNPALYELIQAHKADKPSYSEVEIADITHLQGALRIYNRTNSVYSTFFAKQEKYDYWMHAKPQARYDELLKTPGLAYLALKYMDLHHIPDYPYGVPLFLPVQGTSQYVKERENYQGIMGAAYLLSETARSNVGMNNMPTKLDKRDRAMQDQDLVCTAPFKTAFTTEKHYCSVNFNLGKIPPSYLRHVVIKLGDYVARQQVPVHIQLTPEITLDNDYQNYGMCNYIFTYKEGSGTLHSVTVTTPGSDEIYHGINGFKESLCHLFYVINSIPATPEGNLIKSKIIEHFAQLDAQGLLKGELDSLFITLNQYMEIDFPGGLPLSFKYIDSIHFIETQTTFKVDELDALIEKGNISDFKEFFRKYPQFSDLPFVMREIVALAPPYRLHEITQILDAIYPTSYLSFTENLIELNTLNSKNLKQRVMQSSLRGHHGTHFDLAELISHLKIRLAGNEFAATRKQLMATYEKEVIALRDQLRESYADVQYTGNNSKMQEVLTNPEIIAALTGKNQALLAAILAFEIEAENESGVCDATFIRSAKSQQSGEIINYTLGSILSSALALPQSFIASCPLNTKRDKLDEALALRSHIRQKCFTEKLLLKVEATLVDLCKSYESDINLEHFVMTADAHYTPEAWQDDDYLSRLEIIYNPVSKDDFCANPNIPFEVKEGLLLLIQALYPGVNVGINPNTNTLIVAEVSFDNFMNDFLSTTHVLNPRISHFLFDTLHFGVALTRGDVIAKIQLKDKTISFKDLIEQAMKTINQTGVDSTNSVMAEQLALRTKMLESWCITHSKLEMNQTPYKLP